MTINRQIHTSPLPSLPVVALSAEQFMRLRDMLAAYSGVYLDAARQRLLEHGLARRLHATGDTLPAYERRLQAASSRTEWRHLAELVLNHETVFFRNLPHMQALSEVLLPEIHRRKPVGEPLRIWSAGCATGEEPYSLAIVALATLGWPLARPVEILATDLSEPALQKAREGLYRGRALQNVPPHLLERYFRPNGNGHQVGDVLRGLVRFENLNLLDPFPSFAQGVDIIFCQNVTIYFQLETCRRLIARFYECLPADGLLFLGFSETLWNVFDRFETREVSGAYVYYKPPVRATAPHISELRGIDLPPRAAGRATAPLAPPANGPTRWRVSSAPLREFHDHAEDHQADLATLALGRSQLARGEIVQGFDTLRRISPRSGCAPQALTLIARAHADRGDLDLAAAEARRAIEIDALRDEAYVLLGVIYTRQDQWAEAIRQFERARYLNAGSALISFYLAEAYRQAGLWRKALHEYRNTLRKLDQHPPGAMLDGVAVGWIRESCERQIAYIPSSV
jgi:chemotaxis protein methyltransferase CheR